MHALLVDHGDERAAGGRCSGEQDARFDEGGDATELKRERDGFHVAIVGCDGSPSLRGNPRNRPGVRLSAGNRRVGLVLIGRDEELARLHRVLTDARLHRSGSLVLRGEAGVGKTALLDEAIDAADGFLVLRAVGVAAETAVPFAGLDALLRPILDLLDTIPPAQAQALRGALALEATEPNGLAAYAGALSLLSAAAADRGPVLVVVDDAQWLDRLSIQALTFAARRVAGEGIALLFAARSEPDAAFVATGLDELEVRALSSTDSLELLRARWGATFGPGVARRIVAGTGGNPLALLEVATLLSDRQRGGLDPLGDALPVTESVERSVRQQMAPLSARTRYALLLAAAGGPCRSRTWLPSNRPRMPASSGSTTVP